MWEGDGMEDVCDVKNSDVMKIELLISDELVKVYVELFVEKVGVNVLMCVVVIIFVLNEEELIFKVLNDFFCVG